MRNVPGLDAALIALLIAVALVLVAQAVGVDMVRAGFSEYPAWVFFLLGLFCLLGVRSFRSAALGVGFAALASTFRFDQAVGLALLCGLIAVAWARDASADRREMLLGLTGLGIVFVVIGALPAVHNLYYGHQVAFLLRTPNLPVNFPVPYSKALTALVDPKLRPVLVSQLRGVADVAPAVPSTQIVGARLAFDVAVHGLQVAWLAAVAATVARRRHVSIVGKLLLVLPLAFLVPHLIIQVYVYYPRHIVAGYLAMGLATSYVFVELCGVDQARPVSEAS